MMRVPDGFFGETRRNFMSTFPPEVLPAAEQFVNTHSIASLDPNWVYQNLNNPSYVNTLRMN